ncbi:MAG: hypothetical protein ABIP53_05090 [Candidatus Limnocylindrales bacterium]
MTPRPVFARLGRVLFVGAVIAASVGLLLPAAVSAHPLGNFTINRFHGLTIGRDSAQVDRVVDMAEIPALQARHEIDTNLDGTVSDVEGALWARSTCTANANDLTLTVDESRVPLNPIGLGLTFPQGQAGLVTLRLVCTYATSFNPVQDSARVTFSDGTFAGRLGWQEIVVTGDALLIAGADDNAVGTSDRLRAYPPAATEATRAQSSVVLTVSIGGPAAPAVLPTDSVPFDSTDTSVMHDAYAAPAVRTGLSDLPAEITSIFQAQDLTWPAIVLALAAAMLIGALHAASPGHGKTLMAAYLVGTRGTARHALGLGLTVTISHTIGVIALGALVLAAGSLIPSERLFPILGLVGGLVVTGLGVAMLVQRLRARRAADRVQAHSHEAHSHEAHSHGDAAAHAHPHEDERPEGWHSHGLLGHTHLPSDVGPLRRRNLIALGLVGGLVPSASAILILVGSVAVGRPAFGIVLTVAFGLGMAIVLVGVGLLLVRARSLIERLPSASRLAPAFATLPLVTAVVFLIVGSVMVVQAGTQIR